MTHRVNKAIVNTIILYIRMLFSVLIGLFVTRLVLRALGETDYGIYALVGGVVASLSFLNSSMSAASLRFIGYSLGKNDLERLKRTFNTSIFIHFLIGILATIMIEVGGWYMFNFLLNIPPERFFSAKIVFQFMVASTFVTIISVPYDAIITSHEDFLALSIIEVLGKTFNLFIAFVLLKTSSDKLIVYGALMFLSNVIVRICKQFFSKRKYKECVIDLGYVYKPMVRKMLSFAGWCLFGSVCAIGSRQVTGIIINVFFGVSLNAAVAVARQASSQLNNFSLNLTRALLPRIMKSEGSGDREKMLELMGRSVKFSVYLFAVFALPVLFETSYLLGLWLNSVPDYAVVFCQLFLVSALMEKFTFQLGDAIRAVGDVKYFQIVESLLILLNLPISYVLFKLEYPPQTIYIVPLFINVFVGIVRIFFAHRVATLDIKKYLKEVILKSFLPIAITLVGLLGLMSIMKPGGIRLALVVLTSWFLLLISIRYIGLDEIEYVTIKMVFHNVTSKISLFKQRK